MAETSFLYEQQALRQIHSAYPNVFPSFTPISYSFFFFFLKNIFSLFLHILIDVAHRLLSCSNSLHPPLTDDFRYATPQNPQNLSYFILLFLSVCLFIIYILLFYSTFMSSMTNIHTAPHCMAQWCGPLA